MYMYELGGCCINYINLCHVYGNKMDEKMFYDILFYEYSANGNVPNYSTVYCIIICTCIILYN